MPEDIRWGSFGNFEGPVFGGKIPFQLPVQPSFAEKVLAVTAATEGKYDSINMYDQCVVSVGLIQMCERADLFGTSNLIGAAYKADFRHVENCLKFAKAETNFDGKTFRFCIRGVPVRNEQQQRALFFGDSLVGPKGTWTDSARGRANQWIAALSTIWTSEECRKAQVAFCADAQQSYVWAQAHRVLYDAGEAPDGLVGAMRALYTMYAVNLPSMALKQFAMAVGDVNSLRHPKWSLEWCQAILAQMIYGSGIADWAARYNRTRPVVEKLFGVDLPDMAAELKKFLDSGGVVLEVKDAQKRLIDLGYDLGPWRDDGKFGQQTLVAVRQFQAKTGLPVTGALDQPTCQALLAS